LYYTVNIMAADNRSYVLFDDLHRDHLLPLTFTRPVSDLRIGIMTIHEKWERWTGLSFSYLTVNYLREKYRLVTSEENILINGAVTPNPSLIEEIMRLSKGEVLMQGNLLVAGCFEPEALENFDGLPPTGCKVHEVRSEFNHISRLWHLYRLNGSEIVSDYNLITKDRTSAVIRAGNNLIKPENIFVEEGAVLDFVTINATAGPVYIGKNSTIMEGSLLRGPLAICEGSILKMGTMIYGPTTIGPYSKAGGEITNSVIFGFSNKVHEGYIGNSVIGEWCNIGAGSNASNLKNNFGNVKLWNYEAGKFEDTELQFCGLFMGDYTRCGINTMFNTGTIVGISANIFGSGFPGNFIPSFSWGGAAGFETYRLPNALDTIEKCMQLHQKPLNDQDRKIISQLFALTGRYRKTI
jgi:UDP-N-acetylglucosamine diphosphorylase/glucosamine-1-phosphate N-acetyltransferase